MPSRFHATLLLATLATSALAVQPQFLKISSLANFLEGDIEGLSVDSTGRLSLAPATTSGPDLGAPAVWAIAADAEGVLYAGTGHDGRILKIANQRSETFYTATESEIQALAVGPDGRLYAASNPEGRVYAIDKAGIGAVFFDPEERYIWALAFDAQGRLLVATGGEGKVYRVDSKGQGTPILTSQDTHITSIAAAQGGGLFAGSSPSGLVYSIDAKDNVRVLYDSNYREVKALLPMPNGSVYVALVDGRSEVPLPRPSPSPSPGASPGPEGATAVTSIEVFAFPTAPRNNTNASRGGGRAARGAVFLVSSLGDADQLWNDDESPFFLFKREGAVLFGTASKGRIYEVRDDRTYTVVRTMAHEQLTAVAALPRGEMAIASSNPGKLQYLATKREETGVFTSAAKDFDHVSRVGALEVSTASPGVKYEIRTGNAADPDTTWSDWGPITPGNAPAKSPQARFAQLRATLTGASENPTVSWLQLAYVQRNIRPLVRELTLYPAGDAFQGGNGGGNGAGGSTETGISGLETGSPEIKPPAATAGRSTDGPTLGRKVFFRSLRTLTWRAEDANGDPLKYDVLYRPESATTFSKLREDLDEPIFTWDTATVPSGRYILRVVARDQGANPAGLGLSYEKDTDAFDVDNEAPTIEVSFSGNLGKVVVKDAINAIRKAEWAKEAGTWADMAPLDGIADSREETFEIRIEEPRPPAIVIRATDAFGNVAVIRAPVRR